MKIPYLLVIIVLNLQQILCQIKFNLTPKDDNQYSIQFQYQKNKMNIDVQLSNDKSWVKTNKCKVCSTTNVCQQQCLNDGQKGIDCVNKKYCKKIQQVQKQGIVLQGELASVTLKGGEQKQNIEIQMILAQKIDENIQEIGKINLLQNDIFGKNKILLTKDLKKSTLQVISDYDDDKQQLPSSIKVLGEPIIINSQQQDPNIFEASQLKLLNNQIKDFQPVIVPLIKINAQISLQTNKLELPQRIYKKFTTNIIQKYFQNKECQFNKKGQLICKSKIDLKKLDVSFMEITINGVELQFPIKALIVKCLEKECQFLLGISNHKKSIKLGTFIFDIFAIEHQSNQNIFNVYQLNNQWGQYFINHQQFKAANTNFIINIFIIALKTVWLIIKILFYLAVVVLILNCLYHRWQVLGWFMELKNKFGQAKQKTRQFTGRLAKIRKNAKYISSLGQQIGSDDDQQFQM